MGSFPYGTKEWFRLEDFTPLSLTLPTKASGCHVRDRSSQAGRGKFLAAYQGRMLTVFTHPGAGCRVSYRVGLCLQARALAEELLHAGGRYEPLVWK